MLIIQISDMHVKERGRLYKDKVDTHAFMARAVDFILSFETRPDAVLASGDLVDAGGPREYAALRELIEPLTMPVYMIPGNHDDRQLMKEVFPEHTYLPRDGRLLYYTIEDHPIRIIGLDSLIEGKVGGRIDATQRAWLDATLAEKPDTPTIIMLHHPPAPSGIPWLDGISLEDAHLFGDIVEKHGQILRVLSGHDHRSIQQLWRGTLSITAPSTAHQFVMTFDEASDGNWGMEPPGCLIHRWADGGLVTHLSNIGDYGPPQSF